MVQGHAHINGGANQGSCCFPHPLGHHLSTDGIGADQSRGAVLLRRANGEDDALGLL
jgi:hypothetical protein